MPVRYPTQVLDPFKLAALCWPRLRFYSKQREIVRSVEENDETFVSAGNMLGKDFVAAFVALWFFLSRHPCRVVTTSADGPQLEAVLWGEIRRFVQTSVVPLEADKGGPIVVNHLHLRKIKPGSATSPTTNPAGARGQPQVDGLSYMIGRVAAKGEGMLGHHIADVGDGVPRTLFIADEASGVDDAAYKAAETWARRKLVIGNPYPCTNFFRAGVKAGDLYAKDEVPAGTTTQEHNDGANRQGSTGEPTGGVARPAGPHPRAEQAGVGGRDNGPVGIGPQAGHRPATLARAGAGSGSEVAAPSTSTSDGGRGGPHNVGVIPPAPPGPTTPGMGPGVPPAMAGPVPFLRGQPRCYRKVIRIKGVDSPNVQAALRRLSRGLPAGNELVLEGVLPYADYRKRLDTWDQVAICIGIEAEFWEGAEVLLFPPAWLNGSEARALELSLLGAPRRALAMGCDPGEGGANTCWSVIDRLGLLEQLSMKTPDTSVIVGHTKALIHKWNLRPDMVVFDRGGGGKQIADTLRSQGLAVRTVAFGAPVEQHHERFKVSFADRRDVAEQRYAYKNTRGEMYGTLREWIDPGRGEPPFAIPAHYRDLRAQLAPIPLIYDNEGRLVLPPKGRRGEGGSVETPARGGTRVKTLVELIGHSPDEADSLVLAIHALSQKARRPRAGVS